MVSRNNHCIYSEKNIVTFPGKSCTAEKMRLMFGTERLAKETRVAWSLFRATEPKAPVTYCDHASSVVCPSSVRYTIYIFNFFSITARWILMNLVGMKYSWSLTSVVVFGQIRLGAYQERSQNRSRGTLLKTNSFFRLEDYSNKTNV